MAGEDEEKDRNEFVFRDLGETQAFQNNPSNRHGGGSHLIIKMKATYEFNRRRVHAREHLEEDRDVGRIQGSFGQHGPKSLTSPGVGGSCAQRKCDLTGIMTSG